MTIDINKKVFKNSCSLILEEKIEDMIKNLYLCQCGFVETLETKDTFEFKSYPYGHSKKIDIDSNIKSIF